MLDARLSKGPTRVICTPLSYYRTEVKLSVHSSQSHTLFGHDRRDELGRCDVKTGIVNARGVQTRRRQHHHCLLFLTFPVLDGRVNGPTHEACFQPRSLLNRDTMRQRARQIEFQIRRGTPESDAHWLPSGTSRSTVLTGATTINGIL